MESGDELGTSSDEAETREIVGLCDACRWVRVQATRRGARFYRCALADQDDRFLQYPPLPVRRCPGFDAASD